MVAWRRCRRTGLTPETMRWSPITSRTSSAGDGLSAAELTDATLPSDDSISWCGPTDRTSQGCGTESVVPVRRHVARRAVASHATLVTVVAGSATGVAREEWPHARAPVTASTQRQRVGPG